MNVYIFMLTTSGSQTERILNNMNTRVVFHTTKQISAFKTAFLDIQRIVHADFGIKLSMEKLLPVIQTFYGARKLFYQKLVKEYKRKIKEEGGPISHHVPHRYRNVLAQDIALAAKVQIMIHRSRTPAENWEESATTEDWGDSVQGIAGPVVARGGGEDWTSIPVLAQDWDSKVPQSEEDWS